MTEQTRKNRSLFRQIVGRDVATVVQLLAAGFTTTAVASRTGVAPTSVRTVMGNMTRGRYEWYIRECNFGPHFSDEARQVVALIRQGETSQAIAKKTKLPRTSITTYRANFARGAYDDMR